MWIETLLVVAVVLSGLKAVRSRRLLTVVLWLALSSALMATMMYRAGAPEVAVIELSVGAGLVTILFVFSIAVAGDDGNHARALVPPLLAWLLIVVTAVFLARAVLPIEEVETAVIEPSFTTVMWEERSLDVLVQIGLIFAGVMGILGLLTEPEAEETNKTAVVQTITLIPKPQNTAPPIRPVPQPVPEKEMV
jgi:uncharacterized MnhB-related membrane protein